MITRKPVSRLLDIAEFRKAHPDITLNQMHWALRFRRKNGLKVHVYRRPLTGPRLLLDESPAYEWFNRVVRADATVRR